MDIVRITVYIYSGCSIIKDIAKGAPYSTPPRGNTANRDISHNPISNVRIKQKGLTALFLWVRYMRTATASDPKLPIGSNFCKCGGCGAYFGGVTSFDLHRKKGSCVPPSEVSDRQNERVLRLNDRGYWVRTFKWGRYGYTKLSRLSSRSNKNNSL